MLTYSYSGGYECDVCLRAIISNLVDVSFERFRTMARKHSLAHFIYSETGL